MAKISPRSASPHVRNRNHLNHSRLSYMSVGVCVALLLLLVLPATTGLRCYVGLDIERQCEGVGCVRITRKYGSRNSYGERIAGPNVAMTCLMAATRLDGPEPEGCHTNPVTQEERCVCYDHDYCNSAPSFNKFGISVTLLAFIGVCHVFQLQHVFL